MSRKKRAVAQRWEAIDKERNKDGSGDTQKKEEPISEEEHKKRMKALKDMGLIK